MKTNIYETLGKMLELSGAHTLEERRWLHTMEGAAIEADEAKVRRQDISEARTAHESDLHSFAAYINESLPLWLMVMLAVGELSNKASSLDGMYRSGDINEVIHSQLDRFINVSNAASEAEGRTLMLRKVLSPRRRLYGLTEKGWEHLHDYTNNAVRHF
jgi:hypothetical protein